MAGILFGGGSFREAAVAVRRLAGQGSPGFSVLEALFVVALLGILLVLAFPSYRRVLMERRVQNTTREIAGLMRAAQQAAVAKSAEAKCVGVAFEGSRVAVYVVPHEAVFDCSTATASGLRAHGQLLSSQDYPPGLRVFPAPGDAVVFVGSGNPQPSCSSDGCTAFSARVEGGGHSRAVCVGGAGLVSVPAGPSCP